MLSSVKVHPHFSAHFIALYQASILVYENGCSFIVHDKHKGDIVYARSTFPEENTSQWDEGFLLQSLSDLLESDEVCRYPFPQVQVLIASADYLMVPESIYDADKVVNLFRYEYKDLRNSLLYRNQFQGIDSDLVFLISEHLQGMIHRYHPSARFIHLVYCMLQGIFKTAPPPSRFNFLIYWEESRYFYFLLEEGRLILADHQSISNSLEAVYFIVNLYKHQLLTSEHTTFQMYGNNSQRKEIHSLLRQYLGNCSWKSYLIENQDAKKEFEIPSTTYFYYSILRQCE